MAWLYGITSVVIVSLISLIGAVGIYISQKRQEKIIFFLVSFSVGALFGDALIHLMPEAFEEIGSPFKISLLVILGIIIFFILEKFIRWRHCHVPEHKIHPIVLTNVVGDGVHNLIDGMLIGASYLISLPIGIATTIAVVLHEIPQELGDCGVMLHTGLTLKKALQFNFLSALMAVVGAVISLSLGDSVSGYAPILLPITAGGFMYIAGSDLIPELHTETKPIKSLVQLIGILLGVGLMALFLLVE